MSWKGPVHMKNGAIYTCLICLCMMWKTIIVCNDNDDDDELFAELFAKSMLCLNLRGKDEEERENERDMAFLYSILASMAMIA